MYLAFFFGFSSLAARFYAFIFSSYWDMGFLPSVIFISLGLDTIYVGFLGLSGRPCIESLWLALLLAWFLLGFRACFAQLFDRFFLCNGFLQGFMGYILMGFFSGPMYLVFDICIDYLMAQDCTCTPCIYKM